MELEEEAAFLPKKMLKCRFMLEKDVGDGRSGVGLRRGRTCGSLGWYLDRLGWTEDKIDQRDGNGFLTPKRDIPRSERAPACFRSSKFFDCIRSGTFSWRNCYHDGISSVPEHRSPVAIEQ
jgi:hypothetical protein